MPLLSRRCFRWTHGQQLLFLLLGLSFWSATRILSPNRWAVDPAEKCMIAPESIHCIDKNKSNNNNNNKNNTTTLVSPHPTPTNSTHTPNVIAWPSPTTELRHPNFTFDLPLCFVHVGKAAGSSVSCSLGLMYANCEGMPRQPPLPHTQYFHMRKNNCLTEKMKTLLVSTRNPLTRIQSWFHFEKDILPIRRNKQDQERLRWKRGMIFKECYDNFADFVLQGLELPNSMKIENERPVNMTCQERAWAAALGVREFSYHEWYNYEHYWTVLQQRFLNQNVSIMVLRKEHLLEDWSKLSKEDLYKQVNKGKGSSSVAAPSNSNKTTLESDRFWSNLCRAMCPEIKIYQQILEQAHNLNESQVQVSIQEIQALCPHYDPKATQCLEIPEFPLLRVPRRQFKGETKKRLFAIG